MYVSTGVNNPLILMVISVIMDCYKSLIFLVHGY